MCHTITHRCGICASEAFREVHACNTAPDCGVLTEECKITPFCQDHDGDHEEYLSSRTEGEGGGGEEGEEEEEEEGNGSSETEDRKSNKSSDDGSNSKHRKTNEKSSSEGGSKLEEGSSGTAKRLFKPRSTVRACRAAADPSSKKEVAMWLRSFYAMSN
ncbi:hypothetical protein MMC14_005321 [Varicellaria rhodocarpa]|nr:hypothetical protein [Varicellaria rhodocarpa]